MATVKCVIRKDKINEAGVTPIIILYTHNHKSVKFSTGLKIDPEHWDAVKGEVRKTHGRGTQSFNDTLKVKKEEVEAIKRKLMQQHIDPSVEEVKKEYEKQYAKTVQTENVFTLYEDFIRVREPSLSHNTNRNHRITMGHLKEFAEKTKYKLQLDTLNQTFYSKFTHYLITERKQSPNTVGKTIKDLKTFLNYLTEQGINKSLAYKEFKKPKATTDVVALNKNELDTLYNADLSKHSHLERVRDLLVFSCSTGLRFSDIAGLKPGNITADTIELTTQKTKQRLSIPLNAYSRSILAKYEGKLPKVTTQQATNRMLKVLGKHCGIDRPVEVVKFIGGKRITQHVPKHELMTSHIGRRTFITISLEMGLLPKELMQLTGHADFQTLMRYFNKDRDEVKDKAVKLWSDAPSKIKAG